MKVKLQRTVELEDVPKRAVQVLQEARVRLASLEDQLIALERRCEREYSLLEEKLEFDDAVHKIRTNLSNLDLCVQDCNDMVGGYCGILEQLALQEQLNRQEEDAHDESPSP